MYQHHVVRCFLSDGQLASNSKETFTENPDCTIFYKTAGLDRKTQTNSKNRQEYGSR